MSGSYVFGRYRLYIDPARLTLDDEPVKLTPQAFELLQYFLQHNARPIGKAELVQAVWHRRLASDSAIYFQINHLKHLVPGYIRTIKGQGYVFDAAAQWVPDPPQQH